MAGSAWTNQLVSLIVLTETPTGFSGLFGYSPAPGTGNLIFSLSAASGVDPYGNKYPSGIGMWNEGEFVYQIGEPFVEQTTVLTGVTTNITGTMVPFNAGDTMAVTVLATGTSGVSITAATFQGTNLTLIASNNDTSLAGTDYWWTYYIPNVTIGSGALSITFNVAPTHSFAQLTEVNNVGASPTILSNSAIGNATTFNSGNVTPAVPNGNVFYFGAVIDGTLPTVLNGVWIRTNASTFGVFGYQVSSGTQAFSGTYSSANKFTAGIAAIVSKSTVQQLIASIAGNAGVDPFGNPFTPGFAAYTQSAGVQYVAALVGADEYNVSGTVGAFPGLVFNSLNALPGGGANPAFTPSYLISNAPDSLGCQLFVVSGQSLASSGASQVILQDSTSTGIATGLVTVQPALGFVSGTAPTGIGQGPQLFASAGGHTQIVDTGSLIRNITRSTGSSTGATAGNNTTPTILTTVWSLNGDLASGDLIEIHTSFNASFGATNETFAIGYSLNGGAQQTLATIGAALGAAGVTFSGHLKLLMRIATPGSSGTCRLWLEGGLLLTAQNITTASTANITGVVATGIAINTTVTNTLSISGTWGGAGGAAQAFTTLGSTLKLY